MDNKIVKLIGAILFVFAMLNMNCAQKGARVIFVKADAEPGGDGTSWNTAFSDLQAALDWAVSGNDIWVAAGTYTPTNKVGGNNERNRSYLLKNGISLYGGFAGTESDRDQRNWKKQKTILSGDLKGNDDGFTNNDENSYHVLIGDSADGSAVLDGFIVTAGNADFDTWPDDGGGGMSNHNGSPTIENCMFVGNSAFADGGGMRNWGDTNPQIRNCVFKENKAIQEGGGMMNGPGSAAQVVNCIFFNNSTGEDGGGMYINESNPLVINSVFRDNIASLTGGGIYTVNGSRPNIVNCTISRNKALKAGGGLSNLRGKPVLTNCILWGNFAPADMDIHNNDSTPKVAYSIVSGGYSGSNNLDADPLFTDYDLKLSAKSPGIDAGNNSAIPADITADFEGNLRIYNGIVDLGAFEFVIGK